MSLSEKVKQFFKDRPEVSLVILYGSQAKGDATSTSDVDVAVAGEGPLDAENLVRFNVELTNILRKEVDILDLTQSTGTILEEALAGGQLLLNKNPGIYAELIKKLIYDKTDFRPYYDRILAERRKRYFG
ncbi:MAG: nucleotidyltransferase domain-containing protein [Pseudobdellovibrionaceae bacterium]|nr:nucleotidyltransferase domain-containing protein [Bdellovibrionales bacterium]USN48615.1 MAG: nucleotidyltransferase domain-containing protein [Pseudobdellovibrionaceae bacterium]